MTSVLHATYPMSVATIEVLTRAGELYSSSFARNLAKLPMRAGSVELCVLCPEEKVPGTE